MPLNALSAEFRITGDGTRHFIENNGNRQEIVAYPAMWNEHISLLPSRAICISDQLLKYAMPKVDAIIRASL